MNSNSSSSPLIDTKSEDWLIVKYFVKLATWLQPLSDEFKPANEEPTQPQQVNSNGSTMSDSVQLLSDWEWVKSPKEEIAIKLSLENALRIEKELQDLQKTASSIKLRHYFFKKCNKYMSSLPPDELNSLKTVLDAPKRSAIIKAAIKMLEQEWLVMIRDTFFIRRKNAAALNSDSQRIQTSALLSSTTLNNPEAETETTRSRSGSQPIPVPIVQNASSDFSTPGTSPTNTPTAQATTPPSWPPQSIRDSTQLKLSQIRTWENFENSYQEKAYEKNIAGTMASVGFQASHGAIGFQGLTPRILGDIVWSVFSTLSHAICQALRREHLDIDEMKMLARHVIQLQVPLVDLWVTTIKNSKIGKKNEGKLVARWETEKEEERIRLEKLKKKGADAKFYDEERKRIIMAANAKRRLRGEEVDELPFETSSSDLSNNAGILIIEDYEPHPSKEDFIRAKNILEKTLFGRFPLPPAIGNGSGKAPAPKLPKLKVSVELSPSIPRHQVRVAESPRKRLKSSQPHVLEVSSGLDVRSSTSSSLSSEIFSMSSSSSSQLSELLHSNHYGVASKKFDEVELTELAEDEGFEKVLVTDAYESNDLDKSNYYDDDRRSLLSNSVVFPSWADTAIPDNS